MRIAFRALVAAWAVFPSAASAITSPAIVTYEIAGSAFTDCLDGIFVSCAERPIPVTNDDGRITIDERFLPSRTLISQDLVLGVGTGGAPLEPLSAAGIVFDLPLPIQDAPNWTLSLLTDSNRHPIVWGIFARGGWAGEGGLYHNNAPDSVGLFWMPGRVSSHTPLPVYLGVSGTMSVVSVVPAPVPLPAGLLLLASAVAAIVLAGTRHRGPT